MMIFVFSMYVCYVHKKENIFLNRYLIISFQIIGHASFLAVHERLKYYNVLLYTGTGISKFRWVMWYIHEHKLYASGLTRKQLSIL